MNRIDRQVFKALDQSAGPTHLHPSILVADPRPKCARYRYWRRSWTRCELRQPACACRPSPLIFAPIPIAVGFAAAPVQRKRRSNRPERDPMIRIADVVHQQHRRRIHVADHGGHPARHSTKSPTANPRAETYRGNPRPRIRGNISKCSVAVVLR